MPSPVARGPGRCPRFDMLAAVRENESRRSPALQGSANQEKTLPAGASVKRFPAAHVAHPRRHHPLCTLLLLNPARATPRPPIARSVINPKPKWLSPPSASWLPALPVSGASGQRSAASDASEHATTSSAMWSLAPCCHRRCLACGGSKEAADSAARRIPRRPITSRRGRRGPAPPGAAGVLCLCIRSAVDRRLLPAPPAPARRPDRLCHLPHDCPRRDAGPRPARHPAHARH